MKNKNKILALLAIALTSVIVSFGLKSTGALNELNKKLTHGFYHERPLSDSIVIVGIDNRSLSDPEQGGLGDFGSWPRTLYADGIENLRDAGAHSIFLDVVFKNKQATFTSRELAEMVLDANSSDEVVEDLAAALGNDHPADVALQNALGSDVFLYSSPQTEPVLQGNVWATDSVGGSIKTFTDEANLAVGRIQPDGNEQAVYALPLGFQVGSEFIEGLSLALARDYLHRGAESGGQWSGDDYIFDAMRVMPVERGQFLVNYAGKSYSFPTLSFADVVHGNFDEADVAGKILMIGATSTLLQDLVTTPIDPDVAMPGVELQANAVETILGAEFLKHQSALGFALVLGVLILASVAAFLFLPILISSAVLVLELIAFPFYAQWQFNHGVIVDLIWTVFALIVAYLASLAYRNFTEFKEKRYLKNAFSHYVAPAVVKSLMEQPDALKLGGERRNISVLFLDIENFTHLSEGLQPEQVVSLMNTIFNSLTEVIMAEKGTVDKFEGDAIMALFGAPVASANHAVEACNAALKLQEKLGEINKSMNSTLKIRVGVASGDAIIGNMGSKERFEYTAMGDTVNTASRLEGINKFYATKILVTGATFESVKEQFAFREVDTICPKGKDDSIKIYELLGTAVSDEGKSMLTVWSEGLTAYRSGNWELAEAKIKEVQLKMPSDGPSKTLLGRIDEMKKTPREGWDGVWRFLEK